MLMCIVKFQDKKKNVECFPDSFDHVTFFWGIIFRTNLMGCVVVVISPTGDKLGNGCRKN